MKNKGLKTPFEQKEEEFVLASDVLACLKKHCFGLVFCILLFAGAGFFFRLTREVKYEVKASFKELDQPLNTSLGVVEQIFHAVQIKKPLNCFSLIQSHFLLKEVIEKLGLQADILKENRLKAYLTNIKENWKAEKKKKLLNPDAFVFENLSYEGEKKKNYFLIFYTPDLYEIHLPKQGKIASGQLGKSIAFDNVTFTIAKTPKKLKLNHVYSLSIYPYMLLYSFLKKEMEISSHSRDPWTYEFSFYHRDRNLAKRVLNTLLEAYKNYLHIETEQLAKKQITYLQKRKQDLCVQMDRDLSKHVSFLKENLGKEGFLSLEGQLNIFQKRKQFFLDKKNKLDKQESYLVESGFPMDEKEEFLTLESERQNLQKQRDHFDLALFSWFQKERKTIKIPYTDIEDKMRVYQNTLKEISLEEEKLALGAKQESDFLFSLFPDLFIPLNKMRFLRFKEAQAAPIFYPFSKSLAIELREIRKKKSQLKERLEKVSFEKENKTSFSREDKRAYLQHRLRLISLQEAILKERLFYPKKRTFTDKAIDLNEARSLYQRYFREKEGLENECEKLKFAKKYLGDADFEYISLMQILPDPISISLVEEMGRLVQTMRNSSDLSTLEIKRLKKLFAFKKIDLKRHIAQKITLNRSQIESLSQKIKALQFTILDLLNREISLLEKQIEDRIKQRQKALKTERFLIENQLQSIEKKLLRIPDLWLKEHQLAFSSHMNMKMLETMAELVESKNIQHRLSQIQSKPIDLPYAQIYPKPPRLKLFALLGGLIGLILGGVLMVAREYIRGFSLTLQNIEMQGWKNLGYFSSSFYSHAFKKVSQSNFKVLREISLFISQDQTAQIISLLVPQKKYQYVPFLAELLAKEGKKVLLITFEPSLKKEEKALPNLLTYLRKESQEVPIHTIKGYDETFVLKEDPFTLEHLKKGHFELFLREMKKNYEVILLTSLAYPHSATGKYFLSLSDRTLITLKGLSNQNLYPYFNWAKREGEEKLAFVSFL